MNLDELSITPKKNGCTMFYLLRKWPARNKFNFFFSLGFARARARPEGHLNRTFGARARARTQHPKKFKVRPLAELVYLAQPYTYKMRIFPVQRLVRFLQ